VDNQGVMGYDWNDHPFMVMYLHQPRPTSPKPTAPNQNTSPAGRTAERQ